jgi:hypothetical protein
MKRLSLAVIASSGQAARRAMPFALLENSQTPLIWKCKFSHEWSARPDNVKAGSWCPFCAKRRPLTILELQHLAEQRGRQCLSLNYVNSQTKLLWRCASEQWEATPGSVKAGQWCPHCAKVVRLSLATMRAFAIERKGLCLSDQYVNADSPLRWKCESGHEWKASSHSVRNGSWCPSNLRKLSPWKR